MYMLCTDIVYTFASVKLMYILVQTVYMMSTNMACTSLHFHEHVYREIKQLVGLRLEPMTLCIPASCLSCCSTSVNIKFK